MLDKRTWKVQSKSNPSNAGTKHLEKYQTLLVAHPNDPIAKLHVNRLKAGESGAVITLSGK
jgi:hypothetical protein